MVSNTRMCVSFTPTCVSNTSVGVSNTRMCVSDTPALSLQVAWQHTFRSRGEGDFDPLAGDMKFSPESRYVNYRNQVPSTLNPQPLTLNPKPSTLNPQPSLNLRP